MFRQSPENVKSKQEVRENKSYVILKLGLGQATDRHVTSNNVVGTRTLLEVSIEFCCIGIPIIKGCIHTF